MFDYILFPSFTHTHNGDDTLPRFIRRKDVLNGNFLLHLRGIIKERKPGGKRGLSVLFIGFIVAKVTFNKRKC